jgi:hypothetical protein
LSGGAIAAAVVELRAAERGPLATANMELGTALSLLVVTPRGAVGSLIVN